MKNWIQRLTPTGCHKLLHRTEFILGRGAEATAASSNQPTTSRASSQSNAYMHINPIIMTKTDLLSHRSKRNKRMRQEAQNDDQRKKKLPHLRIQSSQKKGLLRWAAAILEGKISVWKWHERTNRSERRLPSALGKCVMTVEEKWIIVAREYAPFLRVPVHTIWYDYKYTPER